METAVEGVVKKQEAPRHQTLPSPAAAAQARTLRRLGKNTTTTAARASTRAPMPTTPGCV